MAFIFRFSMAALAIWGVASIAAAAQPPSEAAWWEAPAVNREMRAFNVRCRDGSVATNVAPDARSCEISATFAAASGQAYYAGLYLRRACSLVAKPACDRLSRDVKPLLRQGRRCLEGQPTACGVVERALRRAGLPAAAMSVDGFGWKLLERPAGATPPQTTAAPKPWRARPPAKPSTAVAHPEGISDPLPRLPPTPMHAASEQRPWYPLLSLGWRQDGRARRLMAACIGSGELRPCEQALLLWLVTGQARVAEEFTSFRHCPLDTEPCKRLHGLVIRTRPRVRSCAGGAQSACQRIVAELERRDLAATAAAVHQRVCAGKATRWCRHAAPAPPSSEPAEPSRAEVAHLEDACKHGYSPACEQLSRYEVSAARPSERR